MLSSEEEYISVSSEEESEFSWNPSDESFISALEDFLPYDENLEPIATEEEAAQCASLSAEEDSLEKSRIGV